MSDRDERVRAEATNPKIWTRIIAFRRLAQESADVFEIADAFPNRELRELIDDGKSNSRRNSISTD
jgi:hypothetical protein